MAPAGLQNFTDLPPAVYGGRHTVTLIPGMYVYVEMLIHANIGVL